VRPLTSSVARVECNSFFVVAVGNIETSRQFYEDRAERAGAAFAGERRLEQPIA
jgi:hypothetical protein